MPAEYSTIRTAIDRGFGVDNLRSIAKLSLEILEVGSPKHPAVFFSLAALSLWVADAWDDKAIQLQTANRVESQLKPHLEALLDAADGDPGEVCAVLDSASAALRDAIKRGLDT